MNEHTIVAIDPGKTTGFAVFSGNQRIGYAETPPEQVWRYLDSQKPETVVMEMFLFRQRMKVDYTPVEVIGIVKEWCRQHDRPCIFQTPAHAKHFFTDERLHERGLYIRAMPHATDATRHALYYMKAWI